METIKYWEDKHNKELERHGDLEKQSQDRIKNLELENLKLKVQLAETKEADKRDDPTQAVKMTMGGVKQSVSEISDPKKESGESHDFAKQ